MQSKGAYLLIGLALIGLQQAAAWNPFDFHSVDDYDKINEYLTQNVNVDCGDNSAACIDALKSLYETKYQDGKHSFSKVLKRVVDLNDVLTAEKCNKDGLKLLRHANRGTRNQALAKYPTRPIDKLVRQVMIGHAKVCQTSYQELISAAKSQLDSVDVEVASDLQEKNRNCGAVDAVESVNKVLPQCQSNKMKNLNLSLVLSKHSKKDPDYMSLVSVITHPSLFEAKKFYDLYDKYILKSCERFNQKVGSQYLDVLKFDYEVLSTIDDALSYDENVKDLVSMAICRALAEDNIVNALNIKKLLDDNKENLTFRV